MAKTSKTDNLDQSSLGKRLSRQAKVTGVAAGVGARMAGEKLLGMKSGRDDHAKALRLALGNLRGPLVKVAQLLTTIPNAVPEEYVAELRQLQSQAPPMGWVFVKRRMAGELGPDWQDKFQSFEQTAAAAASLGQVHRAVGLDGANLACKLQYPDMANTIQSDLGQLKFMMQLFESYDKAIKTKDIHAEISQRLYEELDYAHEARALGLYSDILKNEAGVHVPQVINKLSTPRLLTMTWLEGRRLMEFTDAPQQTRNQIALNLFRAWYTPFYGYGVIHGDPHLGNYSIAPDHAINLLDFGCVRIFPSSFVGGVIDLYNALANNDQALAVHAYETWGFKGLKKETIAVLNIWARFLYGPILEDKTRTIGELEGTGIYGRDTAHQVHQELKKLGGVTIPREFVFMDRAALGLGSVFLHLHAKVNWHNLFHELIAGFDEKQLAARQAKALKKHDLA